MWQLIFIVFTGVSAWMMNSCKSREFNESQKSAEATTDSAAKQPVRVELLVLGKEFISNGNYVRRMKLIYSLGDSNVFVGKSDKQDTVPCVTSGQQIACGPFERFERRGAQERLRSFNFILDQLTGNISLEVKSNSLIPCQESSSGRLCPTPSPSESFVHTGKVVRLEIENEKSGVPVLELKSLKLSAPLPVESGVGHERHLATRTLSMSVLKDGELRSFVGDCVCLHHPFEDGTEWMNCEIELPRLSQESKNIQRKVKLKSFSPWKRVEVSVHAFMTESCTREENVQSVCEVPVLAESFEFESELEEPLL